jgi:sigma-B regulation protein RsbU (phosphoserine phosphatase)
VVVAALDMRARGFLIKPLDPATVLMKVREAVDWQKLQQRNQDLLDAVQAAYSQLEMSYKREERIAAILQRALLPALPVRVGPFDVGEYYHACLDEAQIGGDLRDVIPLPDGRIGVLIADVSGKGLDAAVQMGMLRYSTRALGFALADPLSVVRELHLAMCYTAEYAGFVTLFYGIYDPVLGVLTYVNAGHEPPLLVRYDCDEVVALDTTGPVIGMDVFCVEDFAIGHCDIAPGDALALFTDGLSELRRGKEFLGVESLCQWLLSAADSSAAEITQQVARKAREFSGGPVHDDITIMVLKHTSGGA